MTENLTDSLCNVCETLNRNAVEYLIIGGAAVALHGYFRPSVSESGVVTGKPDIDVWYNATYKNYFRLLDSLQALGLAVSEFKKEKAPDPKKSFFKLSFNTFTVDFLPVLPGLSKFRPSYDKKEVATVKGIKISLICFEDLIVNKQATARPVDLEDIIQLNRMRTG